MQGKPKKISFVIPIYNEEENIKELFAELQTVAGDLGYPYETIFIDDASTDGSMEVIKKLSESGKEVKYISFLKNSGQSAALYAGFQSASGDVIITLDGDLQNDPRDIPNIFHYFGPYDMVQGWRVNRRDTSWKKVGSKVGNFIRNLATGEAIRDTGCGLKIMRADLVKRIKMYRGTHRFLPLLMQLEGAKIKEVRVNHRPRRHGTSKYTNLKRAKEGLFDLFAVRWMINRHLHIRIREKNV